MRLRAGLAVAAASVAFAPAADAACPRGLHALAAPPTAAERAAAVRTAVRWARRDYAPRTGLLTERMGATAVRWARDWAPLRFLQTVCGARVWSHTLAVTVVFPVMYDEPPRPFPRCAFCAGVVLLVSRGSAGWFVWDAL